MLVGLACQMESLLRAVQGDRNQQAENDYSQDQYQAYHSPAVLPVHREPEGG